MTSDKQGYGVLINRSINNVILSNTINITGTNSPGIYIRKDSNSNRVSSNTISTYANTENMMEVDASNSINISSNTFIRMSGDGDSIRFSNSNFSRAFLNNITLFGYTSQETVGGI